MPSSAANGRQLGRMPRSFAAVQPAFGGLVGILQRDQHALDQPERRQAQHQRQRYPEQQMQPERRAQRHLHPQRQADDDEADDQDDEDRRPVAGIGEGIVEAAIVQRLPTVRKPENSRPSPQRGQRPCRPAEIGSIGGQIALSSLMVPRGDPMDSRIPGNALDHERPTRRTRRAARAAPPHKMKATVQWPSIMRAADAQT